MAASSPTRRRRAREDEIVAATRRLFDERGVQDAPIEQIARAVGINKALIYRHFASKEELFILTVTHYLDEVAGELRAADVAAGADPVERMRACSEGFADYCLAHPAFLDCATSLMRRPAGELRESVSEATWLRLGRAMADCLGVSSGILAAGARTGAFAVADPDFTANQLYAQMLGTMHLARIGVGVRETSGRVPAAFAIEAERVRAAAVAAALASVAA
ncbi:MAG TPA: TetR/AcrR family transcriptional regulator [Solirubrobacteraceae bacterium]|jgi:AcrR family transcriptional regulator